MVKIQDSAGVELNPFMQRTTRHTQTLKYTYSQSNSKLHSLAQLLLPAKCQNLSTPASCFKALPKQISKNNTQDDETNPTRLLKETTHI